MRMPRGYSSDRSSSGSLGERVAVVFLDDEAGGVVLDGPWRWEATGIGVGSAESQGLPKVTIS